MDGMYNVTLLATIELFSERRLAALLTFRLQRLRYALRSPVRGGIAPNRFRHNPLEYASQLDALQQEMNCFRSMRSPIYGFEQTGTDRRA